MNSGLKSAMFSFLKKEGYYRADWLGMEELRTAYAGYTGFEQDESAAEVIAVLKKILCRLFFLDENYTFEDIMETLEHYDVIVASKFREIEELTKKKEAFVSEYKGKKKKRDFFAKLHEFKSMADNENKQYAVCMAIHEGLRQPEVKNSITGLCSRLSSMLFANGGVSSSELQQYMFECIWIANTLLFYHEQVYQGKKIKQDISPSKISDGEKEENQENPEPRAIKRLIAKAQHAVDEKRILSAQEMYLHLLDIYLHLPRPLKEAMYYDLFTLWFNVYFYEH